MFDKRIFNQLKYIVVLLLEIYKYLLFLLIGDVKCDQDQRDQLLETLNLSVYVKLFNGKVSCPVGIEKHFGNTNHEIKAFSQLLGEDVNADSFDQIAQKILVSAFNFVTNQNINFDQLWNKNYTKGKTTGNK